jgi:hypothetical protein
MFHVSKSYIRIFGFLVNEKDEPIFSETTLERLSKETRPRIVKGGEGCPRVSTKMGQETTDRRLSQV